MPLNVAVIGCGQWGKNHVRVYHELEETNLIGVFDIDQEKSEKYASKYGCISYKTFKHVLKDLDIEAVSICTPNGSHFNLASQLIEKSIHCLIEKPVTNTLEKARQLFNLVRGTDIKVMCGHIELFNPGVQEMIHQVKYKEKIGSPIHAKFRRLNALSQYNTTDLLTDLIIHDLYVAQEVFTFRKFVNRKFGSLHQTINAETTNGSLVTFETSFLYPGKRRTVTIVGSDGVLELDYLKQSVTIAREKEFESVPVKKSEPLKNELMYFSRLCTDKIGEWEQPVNVDMFHGLQLMHMIDNIRRGL